MKLWTIPEIARLKALRAEGLSYEQIASKLDRTRGSVASATKLHVDGVKYPGGKKYLRKAIVRPYGTWTDESFVEPYAARKIRLAAERAARCL